MLNDIARHQLKQKWGTMQKVLSSKSRLDQIVMDISLDLVKQPRLETGQGNAMLVAGSVFEACLYYKLFQDTALADHCAIVTSYVPAAGKVSKEDTDQPTSLTTPRQKSLHDNLSEDEQLAINVEDAVRYNARDGWKDHQLKERAVERALKKELEGTDYDLAKIMTIVKANEDG